MLTRIGAAVKKWYRGVSGPGGSSGWWPLIREPFAGAWQRNEEIQQNTVLAYSAVYSCVSLISNDVAKMALKLVEFDREAEIWRTVDRNSPFWPVLRKPNRYQTRIQFIAQWIISKLLHGNAYVLKVRDNRGIVVAMYVLNPFLVQTLVTPDGAVYYQVSQDPLNGVQSTDTVIPASEIIHDRMNCFWHPLVGVSPIYACGLAAMQGRRIQEQSSRFWRNGANPSGLLVAPGNISAEKAKQLSELWNANYGGENAGKVAVLGDGLKFEQMTMKAVDAEMVRTLEWTAEDVARAFNVPGYKIGVGQPPTYNNIAALDQQYYSQCLQTQIESMELCLDEGLGLTEVAGRTMGVECDLDDLIRMDPAGKMDWIEKGIKAGALSPDEGRRRMNLPPVKGGDTPYLQQQNYSLGALADRDAMNPLATPGPNPGVPAGAQAEPEDESRELFVELIRSLEALDAA